MQEELNSTSNALRSTFFNKIPTEEDIQRTCCHLAEKLSGDMQDKNDAKLAIVDLLDDALQGISNFYALLCVL